MKNRKYILIVSLLVVFFGIQACIDTFSPPEVNSDEGYLVVDGFLNLSMDTSVIALRHSQNVNAGGIPNIETRARLKVETEKGESYAFTEMPGGKYFLAPQSLSVNNKYRLDILTQDGRHYQSAFVQAVATPEIDSIGAKVDGVRNAMVFSVNTHDNSGKTRFYRWTFEETYEYNAPLYSALEVIGKPENPEIISRRQDVNTCWRTTVSTNIMLGSTIKLSRDEIKDLPISIVDISTRKLLVRYSVLVKQFGLTREEFEYWTDLSKTTQTTGSLFDPLPSQVTGNIKNIKDNKELVFGYFSAATATTKRIFVSPRLGRPDVCLTDTLPATACGDPEKECALETSNLLAGYLDDSTVLAASPYCLDCRLQGGTIIKPSFWKF